MYIYKGRRKTFQSVTKNILTELATEKNIEQMPDRRSIIVKFCGRDCKLSVILVSMKTKVSGIFVIQCLTPVRKSISTRYWL